LIPYTHLSFRGKLRRLHTLARSAISLYDLDQPQLEYHIFSTNLLYRVTTRTGERFILRLASPGWRTCQDLLSEALWLGALERDTDLTVPRILPARSGEWVLPMSSPCIPGVWHASLMRWLPGRLLKYYLDRKNLERMGALFAALHTHTAAWVPPGGFTTRRFEHWLSRDEPNLLTGEQPSEAVLQLPTPSRQLLQAVHCRVEQAYAQADRLDLRVIHCDLWHENIKLQHGRLLPFDFEDTVWGFRAHDIAMAMLDLLEATGDQRYADLFPAFRRGYAAHLPWPQEPIEPFQVGRLLWMLNWFAEFKPHNLAVQVERYLPVFKTYLRTGKVIMP
jgi:Ser/Thr protein kinase RdoA (MazF antagonist)